MNKKTAFVLLFGASALAAAGLFALSKGIDFGDLLADLSDEDWFEDWLNDNFN
jgi:hypothetical protein